MELFGDKLERCGATIGNVVATVTKHRGNLWGGATTLDDDDATKSCGRNCGTGNQHQTGLLKVQNHLHASLGQRSLRVDNCHIVELFGDFPLYDSNTVQPPQKQSNCKKIGQLLLVLHSSSRSPALANDLQTPT